MPQPSQVMTKDAPGLQVQPSKLVATPGAVLEAQDVDILREGVYEKRRGFNFWGPTLAADHLLQYRLRLLALVGTTLYYDSDGAGTAWTPFAGTHSPPEAGVRIHGMDAGQSFLFTTSEGPKVIEALGATPRRAGTPQGLDVNPSTTGTGNGWMLPDTQVGYRSVFVRKSANIPDGIPGAAGYRDLVANPAPHAVTLTAAGAVVTVADVGHPYLNGDTVEVTDVSDALFEAAPHVITYIGANSYSYTVAGAPPANGTAKVGKAFNVALDITLQSELASGDALEIYRTEMSATEDTDPGDKYSLVKRIELGAVDIAAGTVAFTDTLADELLGKSLESNPSVNGASQAPDRPPWCRYVAWWKGHPWFAHTRQPQTMTLQLLDVVGLVDDTSSITVNHITYLFSAAENLGAKKFKRWTTASTLAENIRRTMRSFVKVLNRTAPYLEAHYTSGAKEAPGIVVIRERRLNQAAFPATANNGTTGAKFSPVLPSSGETVVSDDDYRRNGLYNGRSGRGEACPAANAWRVGSDLDEIRGIMATSGALLVFTSGGVYQISGESDGGAGKLFALDELDMTLVLEAPESLARLDDAAYGWFNQGVCKVSIASSAIVSEGKIGNQLLEISKFSNFSTIAFGEAYETDHKYLFWTQEGNGDTTAKVAWVYNYLRNTWAGPWTRPAKSAVVLRGQDRLFLARADAAWIVRERKAFARSGEDFKDETWACTVLSVDTTSAPDPNSGTVSRVVVSYSGADLLTDGWLFRQGFNQANVLAVENQGGGAYRLTLDAQIVAAAGAAEISKPIDTILRWSMDSGSAGTLKQATDHQLYFEEPHPRRVLLGYQSDMLGSVLWPPPILNPRALGGWGQGWGNDWGSTHRGYSQPVRRKVPQPHQRHRVLSTILRHKTAGEACGVLQNTVDVRVISTVTKR